MTLIQGYCSEVKVTVIIKWFKHSPGHKFSLKAWIGITFHRIITLDPRKCHDLDPTSLVKGQGHYTHSGFRHPSHNFSLSS
jgi:hypothetical protein